MRETLAHHRPKLIFECLPTTAPEPIERLLFDLGYHLHRLTERGPVAIDHIRPEEAHSDYNYLAMM